MPQTWLQRLTQWRNAVAPFCAQQPTFNFKESMSESGLSSFERKLGKILPQQIRLFLLHQSSEINFWWDLKNDISPLDVPDKPYGGYFEFGPESMLNINAQGQGAFYANSSKKVRETWEQAIKFVGVPNGDAIALDLFDDPDDPPVIYLNHESPEKLVRLGDSFGSFIFEWFSLGCVGPEIWNLCHFLTEDDEPLSVSKCGSLTSMLNAESANAMKFKSFFGIS